MSWSRKPGQIDPNNYKWSRPSPAGCWQPVAKEACKLRSASQVESTERQAIRSAPVSVGRDAGAQCRAGRGGVRTPSNLRGKDGPQDPRGKDDSKGGGRKTNRTSLPSDCFRGYASSGLVMMEAKEPPWINEFQGQLGTRLCQRRPLSPAGESSLVGGLRGASAWQPPRESGRGSFPLW